jgi:aromatic ring-opening dioxygenase catalytic subunit (LigB family)
MQTSGRSPDAETRVLYLPHGGGPLPLLGDTRHAGLAKFLKDVPASLGTPSAIVVVSAHWEAEAATVTGAARPGLIYDYYGFPQASYEITYPADGAPVLAREIAGMLRAAGLDAENDDARGFDHGLFVPLKLMYPAASIPCVQVSLLNGLEPAAHVRLGRALSELLTQNILIVGSGMSYHNLPAFFGRNADNDDSIAFDSWLVETCTGPKLTMAEREQRLIEWTLAPRARACHPREEHLLPLHVCFGVASAKTPIAQLAFNDDVMGQRVSAFLW